MLCEQEEENGQVGVGLGIESISGRIVLRIEHTHDSLLFRAGVPPEPEADSCLGRILQSVCAPTTATDGSLPVVPTVADQQWVASVLCARVHRAAVESARLCLRELGLLQR